MARLGKYTISVKSEGRQEERNFRRVDFVINVNSEGLFTTTLDEDLVFELEQAAISLRSNVRSNGRRGYFFSNTKDGLCKKISDVFKELYSRELVSVQKVLRYNVRTCASFGFTKDGEIIPDLGWSYDGKIDLGRHWQHGTVHTHASNPQPTGVQFYIKPLYKRVYEYKSGKKVTEYESVEVEPNKDNPESNYYWAWLSHIRSNKPAGSLQEITYSEQRAKFFVELYKSLCKMASFIAKFENPEDMQKLADSGKLLLNQ